MIEYKRCSSCKKLLPIYNFYKNKRSSDGLLSQCKDCHNEYIKKDRIKNPEKHKQYRIKYYNVPINKLQHTLTMIEYNKKNPIKTWLRGTLNRHSKKYVVNVTTNQLYEKFKLITHCPICGKEINFDYGKVKIMNNSPSLDRINNEKEIRIDNVQLICNQCNITKGSRTMEEFIDYCNKVTQRYL
jgi:hypothetical protein